MRDNLRTVPLRRKLSWTARPSASAGRAPRAPVPRSPPFVRSVPQLNDCAFHPSERGLDFNVCVGYANSMIPDLR